MYGVPFHHQPWTVIARTLCQGGHDYQPDGEHRIRPAIVRDEFDCVISLYRRAGYGPADGVKHHELLIPDGPLTADSVRRLSELAARAAFHVTKGEAVLVRCQAGYNRSGLVVALTLRELGYTTDEAIDLIQARRGPLALHNEHFVNYLHTGQVSN